MGTERYQIIISYDGTNFQGFQRQGNKRTVQGEVEHALRKLSWLGRSIIAAGRTDTGVHATGQVVSFDLNWPHSTPDLLNALNANLPQDIAAKKIQLANPDFHPRFDACWRSYEYRIYISQMRDPLMERYAWRIEENVDQQTMRDAADMILGTHDFSAFGSAPDRKGTTIRTVYHAEWRSMEGNRPFDGLWFHVVANSFLYHMVRRLVFIQVLIGRHRLELSSMEDALNGIKPVKHGLAPAQGLYLDEIGYGNDYDEG